MKAPQLLQAKASAAPWSTVLGVLVSVLMVSLGLRFGAAGLAGTIAIGLFALFVSAAIVSARRRAAAPTVSVVSAPALDPPSPRAEDPGERL